jgi:hypothetical protein
VLPVAGAVDITLEASVEGHLGGSNRLLLEGTLGVHESDLDLL